MPRKPSKAAKPAKVSKLVNRVEPYEHSTPKAPLRPDIGTQPQFKKKLPPKTYRYDSSLNPALEWDENSTRIRGEALIKKIQDAKSLDEAKGAAEELKRLSKPFLNWAGKAEKVSFDVPTLPLFVHERLSTQAILSTLKGHKRNKQQNFMDDLFKDPRHSVAEQVLKAYEFQDDWVNRMILGDSLVIMNSLLRYENMAGKVQMIYMDPPYGVKFGSNFQPFIRKRDVKHGGDDEMTREPEMVQAYRDTWELGLHSYLGYLRDRFIVCRQLLTEEGSLFVQIGDENVHHVRELLEEVFGGENFFSMICVKKTAAQTDDTISSSADYLLWFVKDKNKATTNPLYLTKDFGSDFAKQYRWIELPDGSRRRLGQDEDPPVGAKVFRPDNLTSSHEYSLGRQPYEFEGRTFTPGSRYWTTSPEGFERLRQKKRLIAAGNTLSYVRFLDDFPLVPLLNVWTDTGTGGYGDERFYVVQTTTKIIQRCMLMTTKPGDLVFDPTCGSGTTAFTAEQWGRRWITCDVSRVPLALARQRLLAGTYPFYELRSPEKGPISGFVYKKKQNAKGEEVGGIISHITLRSIANNEPPTEEILVDRPEVAAGITRVSGAFTFEATIPTALDPGNIEGLSTAESEEAGNYVDRMIEILRHSPNLQLPGNKSVTFKSIRPPAKSLALNAEALIANGRDKSCALVFGPEHGAISERLVHEAAREAAAKKHEHLYVIGFAIQSNARELIEHCDEIMGVAATYVQATPDLLMGDLLKNMRSSQIFSVCGLPDISVKKVKSDEYTVKLLGLDVFDPAALETHHRSGDDVPAWFLDSNYNGLSFHVTQAFFPRTQAWDNLKNALRMEFEESAWSHLAGSESAPFEAGGNRRIAVKVIDDRGNELMVVQDLK